MKTRRHHNNTGYRQIKRGKTRIQVANMAKRLKRWIKKEKFLDLNGEEGRQDF